MTLRALCVAVLVGVALTTDAKLVAPLLRERQHHVHEGTPFFAKVKAIDLGGLLPYPSISDYSDGGNYLPNTTALGAGHMYYSLAVSPTSKGGQKLSNQQPITAADLTPVVVAVNVTTGEVLYTVNKSMVTINQTREGGGGGGGPNMVPLDWSGLALTMAASEDGTYLIVQLSKRYPAKEPRVQYVGFDIQGKQIYDFDYRNPKGGTAFLNLGGAFGFEHSFTHPIDSQGSQASGRDCWYRIRGNTLLFSGSNSNYVRSLHAFDLSTGRTLQPDTYKHYHRRFVADTSTVIDRPDRNTKTAGDSSTLIGGNPLAILEPMTVYDYTTNQLKLNVTRFYFPYVAGTDGRYFYVTNGTGSLYVYNASEPEHKLRNSGSTYLYKLDRRAPADNSCGEEGVRVPAVSQKHDKLITVIGSIICNHLTVVNMVTNKIVKKVKIATGYDPHRSRIARILPIAKERNGAEVVSGRLVVWGVENNFTVYSYPDAELLVTKHVGSAPRSRFPLQVISGGRAGFGGNSSSTALVLRFDPTQGRVEVRSVDSGDVVFRHVVHSPLSPPYDKGFASATLKSLRRWVMTNGTQLEVFQF